MVDRLTQPPPSVTLRPALADDRDFLVAVYRTTREDELSLTAWSEAEKAAFVEMQFTAQDRSYRQAYPAGEFLVVMVDGQAAGRLSIARLEEEIRIVDIALLPPYRGRGIGSRLIGDVIAEADAAGRRVALHVEPWNPARRLYERLGFRTVEVRGFYEFMVREPADQLKTAS